MSRSWSVLSVTLLFLATALLSSMVEGGTITQFGNGADEKQVDVPLSGGYDRSSEIHLDASGTLNSATLSISPSPTILSNYYDWNFSSNFLQGTLDRIDVNSSQNNFSLLIGGFDTTTYDWENGEQGWTAGGKWDWGTPTITSCSGGTYCMAMPLTGAYSNGASPKLTSPSIFIPPVGPSRIDFSHWYDIENYYDGGHLQVSEVGDGSWDPISAGYSQYVQTLGGSGYSGNSNGWTTNNGSLSDYSGKTIELRFRFRSDGSVTRQGWKVDDVTFTTPRYETSGSWTSGLITPATGTYGFLGIDAVTPAGTSYSVAALDPGNNVISGFSNILNGQSLEDLNTTQYPQIKLRVSLSTTDARLTAQVKQITLGTRLMDHFQDGNLMDILSSVSFEEDVVRNGLMRWVPITSELPVTSVVIDYGMNTGVPNNLDLSTDGGLSWTPFSQLQKIEFDPPVFSIIIEADLGSGDRMDWISLELEQAHFVDDLSLDIGEDGSTDWAFDANGSGAYGFQTRFRDNSTSITATINAPNQTVGYLRLPYGQLATQAYITVEGVGPTFPVDPQLWLFNSAGADINLLQHSGTLTGTTSTGNVSTWFSVMTYFSWVDLNDTYGNQFVDLELKVTTDNAGAGIRLKDVLIIYNHTTTLSGAGLIDPLNWGLANITPTQGITEVPLNFSAGHGGGLRLHGLNITDSVVLSNHPFQAPSQISPQAGWYTITTSCESAFGVGDLVEANLDIIGSQGSPGVSYNFSTSLWSERDTVDDLLQLDPGNGSIAVLGSTTRQVTWALRPTFNWDDETSIEFRSQCVNSTASVSAPARVEAPGGVENDLEVLSLIVDAADGRSNLAPDGWTSTGEDLYFTGLIGFENDPGVYPDGANVTVNVSALSWSWNTSGSGFGNYNLTVPPPSITTPNGTLFEVKLETPHLTSVQRGSSNITLRLDHQPPQVVSITPVDGSLLAQDRNQVFTLHMFDLGQLPSSVRIHTWLEGTNDTDGDREADAGEYFTDWVNFSGTPAPGHLNYTFLVDDTVNLLNERGSVWVEAWDGAGHAIAPISGPGLLSDLVTWTAYTPQTPLLDVAGFDIQGHEDGEPLLPGVPITVRVRVQDNNGLQDLDWVRLNLTSDGRDNFSVTWDTSTRGFSSTSPYLDDVGGHWTTAGFFEDEADLLFNFTINWDAPEDLETLTNVMKVGISDSTAIHNTNMIQETWAYENDLEIQNLVFTDLTAPQRTDLTPPIVRTDDQVQLAGDVFFHGTTISPTATDYDLNLSSNFILGGITKSGGQFVLDLAAPSIGTTTALSPVLENISGVGSFSTGPDLSVIVDGTAPVVRAIYPQGDLTDDIDRIAVSVEITEDHLMEPVVDLHWRVSDWDGNERETGTQPLPDIGGAIFEDFLDLSFIDEDLESGDLLDMWVTGTDVAGNSIESSSNDEDDPSGNATLILPQFQIGRSDVTVFPDPIYSGDTVEIDVTIRNVGERTGTVVVELFIDGSVLLEEKNITLAGGASERVTWRWNATQGQHDVLIRAAHYDELTILLGEVKPESERPTVADDRGAVGWIVAASLAVILILVLGGLWVVRSGKGFTWAGLTQWYGRTEVDEDETIYDDGSYYAEHYAAAGAEDYEEPVSDGPPDVDAMASVLIQTRINDEDDVEVTDTAEAEEAEEESREVGADRGTRGVKK